MSWNGPVVLAPRAIADPIVCGNTVVFRASEASPRTHMLVVEALVEAGLPPGVLNLKTDAPHDAPEVVDDANVEEAVKAAVFGSFLYQGQICLATERIVVDASIADEFVAKLSTGGHADGAVMPARIVDRVKPDIKICDEENCSARSSTCCCTT